MTTPSTEADVVATWRQHQIWSAVANRLNHSITQARTAALWLGILAAVSAVAAVEAGAAHRDVARVLAVLAGAAAGLVPLVQQRSGTDRIRLWTRARSASEGLKSEVFQYLAGGTAYAQCGGRHLADRTEEITGAMADVLRYTNGIVADGKPVPGVHDVGSYIEQRLRPEIYDYYRPRAELYERRVSRLHLVGNVLGATGAALGVLAAATGAHSLAAWVPVVTTVAASVAAHITGSRYDHRIVEYLRTAQQLESLQGKHARQELTDAEFVDACERVISIENQGWMTNWTDPVQSS
jgi:hypothetical protein